MRRRVVHLTYCETLKKRRGVSNATLVAQMEDVCKRKIATMWHNGELTDEDIHSPAVNAKLKC